MTVLRQKLPAGFGIIVGLGSIGALIFLAWLIGIDPRLEKASITFVGVTTLYLYIIVQISRIIVEAVKQVGGGDALKAGDNATRAAKIELAARKGVTIDE